MLAVLVLRVCLIASPDICRDERPIVTEPLNIISCQIAGQEIAAEWESDHPNWHLSRWGCQFGERAKEKEI